MEQDYDQDDRELRIVRSIASNLILKMPSLKGEREDIEQTLFVKIPEIRKKYLPGSGASYYTYLYKALKRTALNILRDKRRHKRVINIHIVSLDAKISIDSDLTVADTISDNRQGTNILDELILKEIINTVFNKLSPLQQNIARLIGKGLRKADIARHMNIPRTTINDETERIRNRFRKEGLEKYMCLK